MRTCSECKSVNIRSDGKEWYCGNCGNVVDVLYDTEIPFRDLYGNKNLQKLPSKYVIHKERMRNIQRIEREANALGYFDDLCHLLHINKTIEQSIEREFQHLYDGFWISKVITGRGWSWKKTTETLLYTLLLNMFRLKLIQLVEFVDNKFYIFGNDTVYDKNRLSFLDSECRKFMELTQKLERHCKENGFDVEKASVILGRKLTKQSFYYKNSEIDPSIEHVKNKLETKNFLKIHQNSLCLEEVFSFTLTNAWASFYVIVNKLRPKHKMTGLLCACLYSECEKMIESLKIRLQGKLQWANLFGISYETLNSRLKQLKIIENL